MKKIFLLGIILLLLTGCSLKKEKIVIYSSMEKNRNQALIKNIKNKFPDYNIIFQEIPTGNLAAKIQNEGKNIEADIIIDLETTYMNNVVSNLADLSDIDTSFYLDNVIKSKYYLPWVKYTMNLIIDKKYLQEHNLKVPTTYNDLLRPEYKNLIAMPDPKTSGSGYAFYLNAVNIMGYEKAIEYFKRLKNNIREFSISGSGPTNLLKQGEVAIALGMTSQAVTAINQGYDFEIVQLETGSPYNTTSCAIIKDRENKSHVKEVFIYLIKDYGKYDKEHYMPDKILKEQEIKIKNYPQDLRDADMTNLFSKKEKDLLLEKWNEIDD